MATPTVEGFSISHAAILDGSTNAINALNTTATGQLQDIYGVRSGSLEVDTDSFDNTGDDTVLSTWQWFNFATVTIQSGYVSFPLVSLLSGSTITSSGTAPNDYYQLPMWNDASLNQTTRPMVIRVPSKDSSANTRSLDFVLYKVQFAPISFDGPTYKDGLVCSYSGKCLMSSLDEVGGALTDRAIGRLISRPRL